jgi:hypothetical protein
VRTTIALPAGLLSNLPAGVPPSLLAGLQAKLTAATVAKPHVVAKPHRRHRRHHHVSVTVRTPQVSVHVG